MKWTHLLYFGFIANRTKYGRAYATVLKAVLPQGNRAMLKLFFRFKGHNNIHYTLQCSQDLKARHQTVA